MPSSVGPSSHGGSHRPAVAPCPVGFGLVLFGLSTMMYFKHLSSAFETHMLRRYRNVRVKEIY